jgi:uncharacterized protein (DUF427 family)
MSGSEPRGPVRPETAPVAPGQRSAWSFPRPPALEPAPYHLVVVLGGVTVAETRRGLMVLETSHPPNYYFPLDDVRSDALDRTDAASFCEWKGRAHYFRLRGGGRTEADAAWGYDAPSPGYAALGDHVAFYPVRMDACLVDGERAAPQPGGFYGGWITSHVTGPFKGGPGTRGW